MSGCVYKSVKVTVNVQYILKLACIKHRRGRILQCYILGKLGQPP